MLPALYFNFTVLYRPRAAAYKLYFVAVTALLCLLLPIAARANSCYPATGQGAAPANYNTYCWFDFTGFSNATAITAAGQPFSFTLADGATVAFTLKVTAVSPAGSAFTAVASPAWGGAAFGVTGFTGIKGLPILYTGTTGMAGTVTLANITVTPPSGVGSSVYAILVADAESTDGAEYIDGITNGGNWVQTYVMSAAGSTPTDTLSGTTFTEVASGGSPASDPGFSTLQPTAITVSTKGSGLQGFAIAVQATTLTLSKQITNQRANAADQFTLSILATGSNSTLTSVTTSGTGLGPFTATATQSLLYGVTVAEQMAAGSSSTMNYYSTALTCTNSSVGSTTTLPSGVSGTTSYAIGQMNLGDAVACTYSNTARLANLSISKTDNLSTAASGSTVTYVITVANAGPVAAGGATLTDPAVAGLHCTSTSCTGTSGGAVCPTVGSGAGQLSLANLQGSGVVIPTLPASSTVVFALNCGVTATGQ